MPSEGIFTRFFKKRFAPTKKNTYICTAIAENDTPRVIGKYCN
ncbi:MAG: hypothetical protein H6Q19_617 [Bacteroidetes bacterium]|nr:hypothetical protein [Bacteroidota bacterium]